MAGGFDLLETFGLNPNIIQILKDKFGPFSIKDERTAAHFLSFLHKTDLSTITDLEILSDNSLLSQFRSCFAMAENFSTLITDPPPVLIDEKQNLFFYQGYPVHLAPTTFNLMILLAKRPGEVITKDEMYSHLWPDFSNPGSSSDPYNRQISEHKQKITTQLKKPLKGKKISIWIR